jgi:hypothetical protein
MCIYSASNTLLLYFCINMCVLCGIHDEEGVDEMCVKMCQGNMFGSRFISIRAVYEFDVRDDVSHRLHSRLIVGDGSLNWVYHLER